MRAEIVSIFWRERRLVFVALASALLGPLAALVVPFTVKLAVDDVIVAGRSILLWPLAVGAALAVLLQAAAVYGLTQAGAVVGERTVARLRQRLYRHGLALPVAYFDATPTGVFVSRCTADADQVRVLFGSATVSLVSGVVTGALAFVVLAWIDGPLALSVAAILAMAAGGLVRTVGRLHPTFQSVSELEGALTGHLAEVAGGLRLVKSATAERRETLALTRTTHRLLRAAVAGYRQLARINAVMVLGGGGVRLVLLLLGSQAVARGAMTLGDLALVVVLTGTLIPPLVQAAAVSGDLGRGVAALGRIREVLALPTERSGEEARAPVRVVKGAVAFDRVSYRYGSGPWVLRSVSFVVPAGTTVALVGPNGAGKSTVMALLLRLDDPTAGRVLIDGRPLDMLRLAEYRRNVGAVLQRDQVLDGTIADNIRYARPDASAVELRQAMRLSHCDEFVDRLPRGHDTLVGERGVRLSGGQRQRVAIARAFLADPRILLLDEATNQLDLESERLIAEALTALCAGRTTFVVAHRPATIHRAHQILVLKSGAIVERGRHEELVVLARSVVAKG